MELLVTLAVVVILISAAARLGGYVRTRAAVQLTESALAVIDTALEQYYADFGAFPPAVSNLVDFQTVLVGATVSYAADSGNLRDGPWPNEADWPGAALYYFLDRNPNSRSIISALTSSLITNKAVNGMAVVIEIDGQRTDMVRFIDPWGTSLRYLYQAGDAFPRLVSAGPDKIFDTPDDIINK